MFKKFWEKFGDKFGMTIFHPQFFAKKYAFEAARLAEKHAHGILLDIGCGHMPYRKYLEPRVQKYIGLDHPEISQKYEGDIKPDILADASVIPLPSESIDTVLLLMVLEHLPDPNCTLAEINRILKKNGVLIASTVQTYPLHDCPFDFYRYTEFGITHLLTTNGLTIKSVTAMGNFWTTWAASFNTYLMQSIKALEFKQRPIWQLTSVTLFIILWPFMIASNTVGFLLQPFDCQRNFRHSLVAVAVKHRKN